MSSDLSISRMLQRHINHFAKAYYSLTVLTGISAQCPKPAPKSNFTTCNGNTQICINGVSSLKGIKTFFNLYQIVRTFKFDIQHSVM